MAIVGGLLAWWLLLGPQFLGGPAAYVMVRGVSMEPTLHEGDLVIARKHDAYQVGDIVAFHVPEGKPGAGSLIIHRIARIEGERFVMRGDNKNAPDPWQPTADDVVGELWFSVPGAADHFARLREPALLGALMASLTAFFVLVSGPRRPKQDTPNEGGA
jgi:signal peptidase